jgi:glyoxalase superfamily protein
MAIRVQATFDASDPQNLAQFWALALDYVVEPPPSGFDSWDQFAIQNQIPAEQWRGAAVDPDGLGPRPYFQPVPDGKTAKNRVHLDVQVGAGVSDPADRRQLVARHVARLVAAGATRLREQDDVAGYCIVMRDPEGNEFCVA